MDRMTRNFALQMLRRLQTRVRLKDEPMEEEDGQLPQDALRETAYLAPTVKTPAGSSDLPVFSLIAGVSHRRLSDMTSEPAASGPPLSAVVGSPRG